MSERTFRVVLVLLGAYHVAQGALALIDPGSFFDQIGRYGVENDHYVGDVGAFVIAYGIAVLIAIRWPSWRVPVLGLGALWYGFHALNHAFDVGQARSDARGLFDTIALALGAVVLAYLARVAPSLDVGRAPTAKDGPGRR